MDTFLISIVKNQKIVYFFQNVGPQNSSEPCSSEAIAYTTISLLCCKRWTGTAYTNFARSTWSAAMLAATLYACPDEPIKLVSKRYLHIYSPDGRQSCCSVFNSNNMPLNHCQSLGPDNGVSVICAKEYNSTKFEVYITFHFGFMGPNAKNRRTGSIKPRPIP